jgi:hypothetical protein
VVDDSQIVPVRRAVVTLSSVATGARRSVVTDDDGGFTFAAVPAGTYELVAEKPGFITSAFGSKRAGRPGVPVVVDGVRKVDDFVVRLWRGGVIAGVVVDAEGRPMPNVPVRAAQKRRAIPRSWPSLTNNGVRTDDNGAFRIFGLEPGDYIVFAAPAMRESSELTSPSTARIDALIEALRTRRSGGGIAPVLKDSGDSDGSGVTVYAPTFYPAQTSSDLAISLQIETGTELTGIQMMLQRVPTATVSGRVLARDGSIAAGVPVQLIPPSVAESYTGLPVRRRSVTSTTTGQFHITQVLPGSYTLLARVVTRAPQEGVAAVAPQGLGGRQVALATVVVAGTSIPPVDLRLEEARAISGRVRLFQADGVEVSAKNLSGQCTLIFSSPFDTQAAVVQGDGSFSVAGVTPAAYQLRTSGACAPPRWWARSAPIDGIDLLDKPFEFRNDEPLVVTLTDRPSVLAGSLLESSGAPVSDVFVVAYAADRQYWQSQTRRVQAVRPSQDGTFNIVGLPTGEYRIAVVTDADPDDWFDPDFLASLVDMSIPVSIREGQTTRQNLRIGGLSILARGDAR